MPTADENRHGRLSLFLCGDVMTGRGVDQILPHPSDPRLGEPYVTSALGYVELAERAHGRMPRPVDFAYIWGEALDELARIGPAARIINLETSVTTSEDLVPKGINYRMHPANVPCLTAAGVDCCVLANNHVLDWGQEGLLETLRTLQDAGLATAGAGRDWSAAEAPGALARDGGRVLVFAFGAMSSGIPGDWAATDARPGVNLLPDLSQRTVARIAERVRQATRPGDIVVASIHWGGNWGYRVPEAQRAFAHGLVAEAGVDIVHGHSSHHPKGIEVRGGRLILYGCGDFLNDYEGIGGYEEFRGDLTLMYFPRLRADGSLTRLDMTPMRLRRFRLERAAREEARWLQATLDRESRAFGAGVALTDEGRLTLSW